MHFMDLIKNGNFSARQEMECIVTLLEKKDTFSVSVRELFDKNFIKFSNRGPFTSFKQILNYLTTQNLKPDEFLIVFCEMLLSFIEEYKQSIYIQNSEDYTFSKDTMTNLKYLKKQIYDVVDRINHKIVQTNDNYDFIIVPQDKKSIQAAEIVSCNDKDIAIKS